MLKTFKYKLIPEPEQIILLNKHFGSTRFVFNYFHNQRKQEGLRIISSGTDYHRRGDQISPVSTGIIDESSKIHLNGESQPSLVVGWLNFNKHITTTIKTTIISPFVHIINFTLFW